VRPRPEPYPAMNVPQRGPRHDQGRQAPLKDMSQELSSIRRELAGTDEKLGIGPSLATISRAAYVWQTGGQD
jgi:hypothetical protein